MADDKCNDTSQLSSSNVRDNTDDGDDKSQSENETVTMLDVLEEEEELEDNAFAVLGGSDDRHCTYLKGYMTRQALYACSTCQTRDSEPAAICLACTYHCHDGHELFELYTKRNFRCDCGNVKFIDNECKLYRNKEAENDQNKYNDNFKGLYCTCKRPYPDPDNDDDDEMIQCIVCEDWFHGRHLGHVPENDDFAEMICSLCMEKLPFLWNYYIKNDAKDEVVDVVSCDTAPAEADSGIESSCDSAMSVSPVPGKTCKLAGIGLTDKKPDKSMPTFWEFSWRSSLCRCSVCMSMYSSLNCMFLTNECDTVHWYEERAKESNIKVSQYDKGLSELKKMNRLQQIEALQGFNDLKGELTDYLKKFVESKKVVREEDIKEFFQQMKSRKRLKVDVPFNCR